VLIIVGAIGAVLSIAFWASWGGFGHRFGHQTTVLREREVV